jgi:hypothetical protein
MDQGCTWGEEGKIVQLAEYRRRLARDDNGRPPPSPRPAAARRPVPLVSTDVFGRPYNPGRGVVARALISRPPSLKAKSPRGTPEISPSTASALRPVVFAAE